MALTSDAHLEHRANNVHILPPRACSAICTRRTCSRELLALYVVERVPEVPRDHLGGLHALKQARRRALRRVYVRRGDVVDARRDQLHEAVDEFGRDLYET